MVCTLGTERDDGPTHVISFQRIYGLAATRPQYAGAANPYDQASVVKVVFLSHFCKHHSFLVPTLMPGLVLESTVSLVKAVKII